MDPLVIVQIPPDLDRKDRVYVCPQGRPMAMYYWGSKPVPHDLRFEDLAYPRAIAMDLGHDWKWVASESGFLYRYSDGSWGSHTEIERVILVYPSDSIFACESCGSTLDFTPRFCPGCGVQISP